ncbi:hypothetical protein Y032_0123g1111 [Ancylostoma ceylanicum]|uniref:IBR domain-containing protein n=1 Tax=Ancylostoma ceylanicum TaxID=53326 RepID=A0A016T999_9BILA|nr:hypothetical protein Y032_0123g1111 [Ancylostoma ceylanicum]
MLNKVRNVAAKAGAAIARIAGQNQAATPIPQSTTCVRCMQVNCVRIVLRQCGHVSCVACLLDHLKFWIRDKSKARIKCVKLTCPVRIHENDINAVLDEQEDGLNLFMPLDHRQWLQYYHNKDVIYYALGGNDMVKQCPLCKSMYTEKEGCSYVTCANLRCRTRFCWQCGDPIENITHFAGQTCRVGYDDIERGLFWVKLAIDIRPFALIIYLPVFFLACMIGIPLFVFFAFPTFIAQRIYDNATSKTDYLTQGEWALVIFKIVTIATAGLPVGLFLSLNSLVSAALIFTMYVAFMAFKLSPAARLIEDSYDIFLPMASSFGLGPYKQMLKDGKEAKRRRKQLLREQAEMEASERAEIVEVSSGTRESTPVESGTGGT